MRKFCRYPYEGHPKGCPNYGKRSTCPPEAPLLQNVLDLRKPVYVIWNKFPIGEHAKRMWALHPNWTERQAYYCLYWQRKARKQLKQRCEDFFYRKGNNLRLIACPEACGVNVSATMHKIGEHLEWPPRRWAYQVALAGQAKKDQQRLGNEN